MKLRKIYSLAILPSLFFSTYTSAEAPSSSCADTVNANHVESIYSAESCATGLFAKSHYSAISNFNILDATTVSFNFTTPNDLETGWIMVWKDTTEVDFSMKPLFKAPLSSNKGHYVLHSDRINFQQGIYTIAITAGKDEMSVAATRAMVFGQPAQSGGSAIAVTRKALTGITATYLSPPNVVASDNLAWLQVFDGTLEDSPEQNAQPILEMTSPLIDSSGVFSINFPAGMLKNYRTYTLIFNPGRGFGAVAAAHTFKYILQ
ncbi:hypothetical protein H0A36_07155 [Endozoicomonas sp. SM1973]|uniref:Uncharacterized protein n=1 Tax=Spartinivicinus marinus TaxID=2994442 RepID=A0A853I8A0_9GAMM|nr:hypothetical protein [Spartinivicinus marinus]MCX4025794.1 hypothetical protein [Spartinivicinus marinus]NYZ65787.1 hypothetical protein [Spartinivicinus marinus]